MSSNDGVLASAMTKDATPAAASATGTAAPSSAGGGVVNAVAMDASNNDTRSGSTGERNSFGNVGSFSACAR
jgi:hypothetical protein